MFNIDERIKIIRNYLGDVAIKEYKTIDSGMDNFAVVVNDELVFRFLKDEGSMDVYKKEV